MDWKVVELSVGGVFAILVIKEVFEFVRDVLVTRMRRIEASVDKLTERCLTCPLRRGDPMREVKDVTKVVSFFIVGLTLAWLVSCTITRSDGKGGLQDETFGPPAAAKAVNDVLSKVTQPILGADAKDVGGAVADAVSGKAPEIAVDVSTGNWPGAAVGAVGLLAAIYTGLVARKKIRAAQKKTKGD